MQKTYWLPVLLLGLLCWLPETASAQRRIFLGQSADQWRSSLTAPDAATRRSAAFALGKLGATAAPQLESLLRVLREDKQASVREAAAFAIGEICRESINASRQPELLPALRQALSKDPEPLVRRSAAFALGCLGQFAEDALSDLDQATQDDNPAVRQNVAWALGEVGRASVVSLRKCLHDKSSDPLVLRDAAAALGKLKTDALPALPDLLQCCNNPNVEVKKATLATLVRLVDAENGAEAVGPLTQALRDNDLEVSRNAALALGNIGGEAARHAVPILVDALKHADPDMQRQAAAVIRNIGPAAKSALPALQLALRSDDEHLRRNAALALGGIGPDAQPAVPALVNALTDKGEKPEVRMEAASALSRIGSCPAALAAVPRLIQVLTDTDTAIPVRAKTLWALRAHQEKLKMFDDLFPALEKVLREPKQADMRLLRYDCAFILGVFQRDSVSDKVMETLNEFLHDDTIIIYTGTSVKGTGGSEGGAGTANIQESGKGDGRVMAVDALRYIGPRKINQHPEIRRQLQAIANNMLTLPDLRMKTRELLSEL